MCGKNLNAQLQPGLDVRAPWKKALLARRSKFKLGECGNIALVGQLVTPFLLLSLQFVARDSVGVPRLGFFLSKTR